MRVLAVMRIGLPFILTLVPLVSLGATRTIHVKGTVANIQTWEIKGYYTALNVGAKCRPAPGSTWLFPGSAADQNTGSFQGELKCEVIRNAHGEWVDIHLVAMSHFVREFPEMIIRVPYARIIDPGTFDWKPSRYRLKPSSSRPSGEGTLVIETALPRDTIVGDRFSTHIRVSPVNPTPTDSVQLEFIWENSGQPHKAALGGLYMKDCCTLLCDFTFAVRTNTVVFGESWPHHAKLFLPPPLQPGRYRLRQIAATGEHLRDVDFLLDKELYFTVGERSEP